VVTEWKKVLHSKMVATFNSTGTPSLFLHASEVVTWDLGMIQMKILSFVFQKSKTVLK
jgi:arabinose-5-phosphate isomerase